MLRRNQSSLLPDVLALCLTIAVAHAQFPGQKTYCNPIEIEAFSESGVSKPSAVARIQ